MAKERHQNLPGERNGSKGSTITTKNKHVGDASMLHGVFLVSNGLVHAQPPNENSEGRNNAKSERQTPYRTKMIISKAMTQLSK
jgi:hypothetical protein